MIAILFSQRFFEFASLYKIDLSLSNKKSPTIFGAVISTKSQLFIPFLFFK